MQIYRLHHKREERLQKTMAKLKISEVSKGFFLDRLVMIGLERIENLEPDHVFDLLKIHQPGRHVTE